MQTLIAYGEGRANVNDVLRALTSHQGWFVPLSFYAKPGESRKADSLLMLGGETQVPDGELWVFTDEEAARLAQAKGATLGSYAGGMAGTELFRTIPSNLTTVYINPGSPPEDTWLFREGSATSVGALWANAIALEESFAEWERTGKPDKTALMNFPGFLLYDHVSGPVITLPDQGGMQNPAAAFTAPDCAEKFVSELSDEERAILRPVTIDGKRLLENRAMGIDGLLFNFFGPGVTYALRYDSLGLE